MSGNLYFISHAASDKEIATVIYDFLTLTLQIPSEMVFCASQSKQIPASYDNYPKYIKEKILNTKNGMVIALITEEFMKSEFCKYEIGAAWALDIPVHPVIFPSIRYNDDRIMHSPLLVTQFSIIDKEKLQDTIFETLSSIIYNAQNSKEINAMISRVSENKRTAALFDMSKKLTALLDNQELEKVNIDIMRHTCGVYHANYDIRTLKENRDIDEKCLELSIDFSSCTPDYVGYYVQPIKPKDWTKYVLNKYFLRFDAYASGEIGKVIVEINNQKYGVLKKEHSLSLGSWKTYSIYLGHDAPDDDEWADMKEVCFVVKPYCMTGKRGVLRIMNLRLERDPR